MTRPDSEQPPSRRRSEPAPSPERGPPAEPPDAPSRGRSPGTSSRRRRHSSSRRHPPPPPQEPPPKPPQQRNPAPARARRESRPGEQQPALTRPSAVLDEAHLGDIEGALGRIRVGEEYSSTWRRRLVTFLAIVGPGLIVMVGDNDAAVSPPTPRRVRTTGTACYGSCCCWCRC